MSAPAAQSQASDQQVLAAATLVLLAGLPLAQTAAQLVPLLRVLGIGHRATAAAASLLVPQIDPASLTPLARPLPAPAAETPGRLAPERPVPPTPAQAFTRTTEVPRHTRYLVAAARRFEASPEPETMQAERRFLAQHLAAIRATRTAAARVDEQVARYGQTLGWRAQLDERTTPECRAAHGSNFSAGRPPRVGYPGTLHGGTCRCRAGAPFHEGLPTDEAVQTNLPRITGAHDVAFSRSGDELVIDLIQADGTRSVLSRAHAVR